MTLYAGKDVDEQTINRIKKEILEKDEILEGLFKVDTDYSFTNIETMPKHDCLLIITNKNLILEIKSIFAKDVMRFDYDKIVRVDGEPSLLGMITALFGKMEVERIMVYLSDYNYFGQKKKGESTLMLLRVSEQDGPNILDMIQKKINQKANLTISQFLIFEYVGMILALIGFLGFIFFGSSFISVLLMAIGIIILIVVNYLRKKEIYKGKKQ